MSAKKLIQPIIVKKLKPYPIDIQIVKKDGTPPLNAKILRVNTVGLQMENENYLYKVGEEVTVTFVIPNFMHKIDEVMKVIKTTDRFKDDKAIAKAYLTELHFIHLDLMQTKKILEFTRAIRQKD